MKKIFLTIVSLLFLISISISARSIMHTTSDNLSASDILQVLKNAGYQQIREMELEHGVWEIEALDNNQQEVKIKINPVTGKFIPHQVWSTKVTMQHAAKKIEKGGNQILKIELKKDGYYKIKVENHFFHHTLYVDAKTGKINHR